jgi:hypothetical protein
MSTDSTQLIIQKIPINLEEQFQKMTRRISQMQENPKNSDLSQLTSLKEDLKSIQSHLQEESRTILKGKEAHAIQQAQLVQEGQEIERSKQRLEEIKKEILQSREELERKETSIAKNLKQFFIEEERVTSTSLIGKIRKYIIILKEAIVGKNSLEIGLVRMGYNPSLLNDLTRRIVRAFGSYEFSVVDGKFCQSLIITILMHLNVLMNGKESHHAESTEEQIRAFYKAQGSLKLLFEKFSPFDNYIHDRDSKPLQLIRLFSSLEPTIAILTPLDQSFKITGENKSVSTFFSELPLEDRIAFIQENFEESFIEKIPEKVQKSSLTRLLNIFMLSPAQVMVQVEKWRSLNQKYLGDFLGYLKVQLTEVEKLELAHNEIEQLKRKGMINIAPSN